MTTAQKVGTPSFFCFRPFPGHPDPCASRFAFTLCGDPEQVPKGSRSLFFPESAESRFRFYPDPDKKPLRDRAAFDQKTFVHFFIFPPPCGADPAGKRGRFCASFRKIPLPLPELPGMKRPLPPEALPVLFSACLSFLGQRSSARSGEEDLPGKFFFRERGLPVLPGGGGRRICCPVSDADRGADRREKRSSGGSGRQRKREGSRRYF